jgi:hypothetical protein
MKGRDRVDLNLTERINMEITVPTNTSFECPEGTHSAAFSQHKEVVKHGKRGEEKYVRLLFEADQISTEETEVLVGRNFVPSLKKGSDLRTFLDTWLGDEFVDQNKVAKKFNFDSLNGKRADIIAKHIVNEEYPKPFVHLQAAYPAGSHKAVPDFKDESEGI